MGIKLSLINDINNYLLKGLKVDFTFVNIVSQKYEKKTKKRKKLNRYDKFSDIFYKRFKKVFKNF